MTAQGWCPSTFRLFDAADGGLARVTVPGGILDLDQVRAVATAARSCGNGTVEITSRANLQIRGVDPERATDLRAVLAPVGLSAPTAEIEDRRNVMASPTAGLAHDELIDVRSIVGEVVASLDEISAADELPHKFGVLLDGGGCPTLRGRAIDVAFGAVLVPEDDQGAVAFEVALGDSLPIDVRPLDGAVVTIDAVDVPAFTAAAARVCAGEHEVAPAGRMAEVVGAAGLAATLEAVVSLSGATVSVLPDTQVVRTTASDEPPLGPFDGRASGTSYLGVAPGAPLSPEELDQLADALDGRDLAEVRLTPWRTIVIPGVSTSDTNDLLAQLATVGWSTHSPALAAGAPA